MKNSEFVNEWVLDTVKSEYPDDIALVVSHTTLRIDDNEKTISYFVPCTPKGYQLSRTFILDGEGFDIWAIDWERLERFAALEEYNITCLIDGEVLYARTPEDRKRFEDLQKLQKENLANPVLMRKNALEAYAEAKKIYFETLFADGCNVKMGAGYVLDYLAQAIAFTNLRYFKKSQTDQIAELMTMERVPEGFLKLYQEVITARDDSTQKKLCYDLIRLTQDFLQEQQEAAADAKKEHNFQDLADWYGELSYTWLRIRHYTGEKDALKSYMWGIMLQQELNCVCSDFDLPAMDLMTAYDAGNLSALADCANRLEVQMRAYIEKGGGIIHEYKNAEEFKENYHMPSLSGIAGD